MKKGRNKKRKMKEGRLLRKEEMQEGRNTGRKEHRKEGTQEERKVGRKEGWMNGRKER
jgi:hypothetical protein